MPESEQILLKINFPEDGSKTATPPVDTVGWPPPETIFAAYMKFFDNVIVFTDPKEIPINPDLFGEFKRIRYSELTGEQIASMSHVMRGGEYEFVRKLPADERSSG